jgi:biofilm PGA synthesis N-glycosyltransferase PgaC
MTRETAMDPRLLIISPVRDEAEHIERVARSVAAQTRPPDAWVVVDDGSEDKTTEILHSLAGALPFMRIVSTPAGYTASDGDRLAAAAAPRAFNWGLRLVQWREFTHLGKLDGDVELPPEYFERLLAEFDRDPALGIAGGVISERIGPGWRLVRIPRYHVRGALKVYTRECLEAIGGVQERLGWDTIDETYARMRGFSTRSVPDLVTRHHRHWGTADGSLRGRARHGECAYVLRYGLPWALLRSLKVAAARPRGLSGAAFVYGYLRAAAQGAPKVDDDDFRRFVRRELRRRMLHPFSFYDPDSVHLPTPAGGRSRPSPREAPLAIRGGGEGEPRELP